MAYHQYGRLTFRNKNGTLTVEPVTEVMDVRNIHSKDVPAGLWFDKQTAEQIALITENWHVQLGGPYPIVKPIMMWLIAHTACDKAFLVKIVTLEYIGPADPMTEIERCNRCTPCLV